MANCPVCDEPVTDPMNFVSAETGLYHPECWDAEDYGEYYRDRRDGPEDNFSDAEADADTLASAGMGTDEDYGYYGDREDFGSDLGTGASDSEPYFPDE